MDNFWFYTKLGLNHVLDLSAYDHILFLAVLAVPFTFKNWKKVIVLATVFTIAHCFSLTLSVYNLMVMDIGLIEFLIPITIFLTGIFNLLYIKTDAQNKSLLLHILATAFFGLIHGFGFSNYFKMLVAEETNRLLPLLGFATGIEISQITVVLSVLAVAVVFQSFFRVQRPLFILAASILIILITIPMLVTTFPW